MLLVALARGAFATGYFGPTSYLDEGGRRVTGSPEFFWELEVKRLSHDFHPPEKMMASHPVERDEDVVIKPESVEASTAEADEKDFANAIEQGAIKPPDRDRAMEQHKAGRTAINDKKSAGLPEEFSSEFGDYHRGAFAFSRGSEHFDEARKAWEGLLTRPPNERKYRSVWAAFMLGKIALKKLEPEAVGWFQRTRELAGDGFNDSLGMAADSYGWEGRSEWKQGHPEKAASLFLTQLSLGDESAVVSLKAVIPDRIPAEGLLNYGPEPEEREKWDDATKRAQEQKEIAGLKAAARHPLLRRLVTAHILATQYDPFMSEDTGRPAVNRAARWLAAIQQGKIAKIDDAEYLGWIAYTDGKYDQAAHWLSLSSGESPAALWLKSKLQLRAGKIPEATKTMAKAWETLRDPAAYTGWEFPGEEGPGEAVSAEGEQWGFVKSASGDFGALRLARSEFVGALDVLAKAKMWSDAAFVAERVLTADELKKYVDTLPRDEAAEATATEGDLNPEHVVPTLRYILGRRLVREDRYVEARPYLPLKYQERLDVYVKALNEAASAKLSKMKRARAYFKAGWIARYDGMELMGTEGAPDGFISEGNFPEPDLAKERETGAYVKTSYDNSGEHKTRMPAPLKPNAEEKARLTSQKIRPDVRFHYRVIAAALALRAAELLPDNSDELADVLNYGGEWAQDRDQKLAEKCFLILKQRAGKTDIGTAAVKKHWFTNESGPWSTEEQAAEPTATPNE